MVIDQINNTINKFLEDRRRKKAEVLSETSKLDSYRETEEIRRAEQLKKEADRLVHLKQYRAAIKEYHNALETYPFKPGGELHQKPTDFLFMANYNLGAAHMFLHEFKDAFSFFDSALSLEKAHNEMKVLCFVAKGNCYYKAKKFLEHAPQKHSKEITADDRFEKEEKIIDQMRKIDEKENLLKKAHECYTHATELSQHDADIWYEKGHMEFLLGMIKEAIFTFDKVLELNQNYENKEFIEVFDEIKREKGLAILEKKEQAFKSRTGHFVKNKAELMIANFLFDNNLLFQYNMPAIWAEMNATFYIPKLDLYIEHVRHEHEKNSGKMAEYRKHNKRIVFTLAEDEAHMDEILRVKMKPYISL